MANANECGCAKVEGVVEGVKEQVVREPVLAVYEDGAEDGIRIFEPQKHLSIPFACETSQCLPWMRVRGGEIVRGPRFKECLARARALGPMRGAKELYGFIGEHLAGEDQETFVVICLDTQLRIRGIGEIGRGARDHTPASVPDAIRLPVIDGAMVLAVAHNHPSGMVEPSDADTELTKAMCEAAKASRIPMMDHMIVGGSGSGKFFSFREQTKILKP